MLRITKTGFGDEVIFIEKGSQKVIDFMWMRTRHQVLSELKYHYIFEALSIYSLKYFSQYHANNIFHGDIKPENIFI